MPIPASNLPIYLNSALRRDHLSRLSGKTVVFVSPGHPGKRFVFDTAHQLGIKSVVIDSFGSWTQELTRAGVIESLIELDMCRDEDSIFKECVTSLSKIGTIDGICTFVELSAPLTARLCEHFKVAGHSVSAVASARNKHMTRQAVERTPSTYMYSIRTFLIQEGTRDELSLAAEKVGFPAVLKPVSGAASLGVQKVTSLDELIATYNSITELLSDLVVSSGALERRVRLANTHESESESTEASAEQFHSNLSLLSNTSVVLEEYLSGQEVDIDVVLSEGQITYCEISDNGPTCEPYFGETYNNCPSVLSESDQNELRKMAHSITVDALGFRSGVFHVEAKMCPNGPRLIEVNCRMGGGPVHTVQLRRSGVDLVVEQLLLSCGLHSKPEAISPSLRKAVGFCDVNATKSGCIRHLDFLKGFEQRPGMVYCKPFVNVGEHIVGPEEGQPTWLAEVVFTRDRSEDAVRDAKDMYLEIQQLFENHYV